jgi:DNA polymerase III gamma/tau subunit
MEKRYDAEFTNDLLALATFKLAANNNAMLQVVLENIIEIRKELLVISTLVDPADKNSAILKEAMKPTLDEITISTRQLFEEMKQEQESISMREAYEWAFLRDPDSGDISNIGI